MKITIKTSRDLCELLEATLIKMHDEFLNTSKESVFDWLCEATDDNLVEYEIFYEKLSKNDVSYMMETLQYLKRNFNG
jgi:hypothetical protein